MDYKYLKIDLLYTPHEEEKKVLFVHSNEMLQAAKDKLKKEYPDHKIILE